MDSGKKDDSAQRPRYRKGQAQATLMSTLREDEEFRNSLRDAKASAFLYDKSSQNWKRFKARTLEKFIAFVKVMAVGDGLEIRSTDLEAKAFVFQKAHILEYVCQYLKFLVVGQDIAPTGMVARKIKLGAVSNTAQALWWFVSWELGQDSLAVSQEWHKYVPALLHKLATEHGLGIETRPKEYFGPPELRLFFLRLMNEPQAMSWWKQLYVCWAVACITGARPSSLCAVAFGKANTPAHLVQTLRWKDIEFINVFEQLAVRITLHFVKGRRDPHINARRQLYRPAQFLIKACKRPQNLHADLPWLLFALAYERALFGNRHWTKVLEDRDSRLKQDPNVAKNPVFVTCDRTKTLILNEPLYAGRLNPPLKTASREVGLNAYATMYTWRREALTAVCRNANLDIAKQVAVHHVEERDTFSHYDYGTGDMDLGQIRLGEYDDLQGLSSDQKAMRALRNETRMLLESPAVTSKEEYPIKEEKEWVDAMMADRNDVAARREARQAILEVIHEKFDLSVSLSYPKVFRALKELNGGADVSLIKIDDPDPQDHHNSGWLDAISAAKSPASVIGLLKGLRRMDLSHIIWVREGLQREFRQHWYEAREAPSRDVVEENARLAVEPVTFSVGILNKAAKKFDNNNTLINDRADHDSLLESKMGEWTGILLDDPEVDMIDDVDADLEKDTEDLDPIGRVVNSFPDDEDVVFDVGEPDVATEDETLDVDVVQQRMELLKMWFNRTDENRGPRSCPFCEVDVSGRVSEMCRHSRFASEHFHAFHANEKLAFIPTSYAGMKKVTTDADKTGKWNCRLCAKKFTARNKFVNHYKTEHSEFCGLL